MWQTRYSYWSGCRSDSQSFVPATRYNATAVAPLNKDVGNDPASDPLRRSGVEEGCWGPWVPPGGPPRPAPPMPPPQPTQQCPYVGFGTCKEPGAKQRGGSRVPQETADSGHTQSAEVPADSSFTV